MANALLGLSLSHACGVEWSGAVHLGLGSMPTSAPACSRLLSPKQGVSYTSIILPIGFKSGIQMDIPYMLPHYPSRPWTRASSQIFEWTLAGGPLTIPTTLKRWRRDRMVCHMKQRRVMRSKLQQARTPIFLEGYRVGACSDLDIGYAS